MPVELFGQSEFPEITDAPYLLTLSPFASLWFLLTPKAARRTVNLAAIPQIRIRSNWTEMLSAQWHRTVERRLPIFLKQQAWFLGRGRTISTARIRDYLRLTDDTIFCVVNVDYNEADPEDYLLPLSYARAAVATGIRENFPHLALLHVEDPGSDEPALIFDSAGHPAFWQGLMEMLLSKSGIKADDRPLAGVLQPGIEAVSSQELELGNIKANQHNNKLGIGRWLLRQIHPPRLTGNSSRIGVERVLTTAGFPNLPPLVGSLVFHGGDGHNYTTAIVTARIPNTRTAWEVTLDSLGRFFERVITHNLPPSRSAAQFPASGTNIP